MIPLNPKSLDHPQNFSKCLLLGVKNFLFFLAFQTGEVEILALVPSLVPLFGGISKSFFSRRGRNILHHPASEDV